MRTLQDYGDFLTNLQKVRQEAPKQAEKKATATQVVELKNTKPCK